MAPHYQRNCAQNERVPTSVPNDFINTKMLTSSLVTTLTSYRGGLNFIFGLHLEITKSFYRTISNRFYWKKLNIYSRRHLDLNETMRMRKFQTLQSFCEKKCFWIKLIKVGKYRETTLYIFSNMSMTPQSQNTKVIFKVVFL